VETDPTRMCELLVGLPDVNILGVDDGVEGFLCIYIESSTERPECSHCGVLAQMKDRSAVELVDLVGAENLIRAGSAGLSSV
jgi:hypothetical protein